MATNLEKLEKRFRRLRDQQIVAAGAVAEVTKAHGLTMEWFFIMPAMDSVLESIGDIERVGAEVPESLLEFRRMAEVRQKKIDSLPPEVRVAISRFIEIEGLYSTVQGRLVRELAMTGIGIPALAKRLNIKMVTVKGILVDLEDGDSQ